MITKNDFFTDVLDLSIPELQAAKDAFDRGETETAEKLFADYARAAIRPEILETVPQFSALFETDDAKAIADADEIVAFRLTACRYTHQYTPWAMDWSLNPTPNQFCEFPWIMNRCPMFATLAVAYRKQPKPEYAKVFAYLMDSWIEQNEFPLPRIDRGAGSYDHVAWRSIETGCRTESTWPLAIHTFLRCPEVSDRLVTKIFMSLWEHAFQLEHFYSSHNWLIIEMTGLFNMATVYPFFRRSKHWQQLALGIMGEQLAEQLYPEGFQYELTTAYHRVCITLYSELMDLAQAYDVPGTEKMLDAVHKMHTVNLKLAMPDMTVPGINDAGTFDCAEMLRDALKYFPDDEVFRWGATNGREGHEPDFRSVVLPTVGFSVMRTGWDKNDIWALFDSAYFGWGHQHEDKLNFTLYAYGKKLLEDPGNYEYDASDMRCFICSTRSHNTALVDRMEQNRRATFSRATEEKAVREGIPSDLTWRFGEEADVAEGSYDFGYGKDPESGLPVLYLTHHRKVIFFRQGLNGSLPFFLLVDTFVPKDEEEHLYEVLFQLGTRPVRLQGHTVFTDYGDGVSLRLISSAYPQVLVGQYLPRYMGWQKDSSQPGVDHEHFPAPAVLFTEKKKANRIATVVYPDNRGDCPVAAVSVSAPGEAETYTFTFRDGGTVTVDGNEDRFATFGSDGTPCRFQV